MNYDIGLLKNFSVSTETSKLLVVAVRRREGEHIEATVVHGTRWIYEDIKENLASFDASECIGPMPTAPGMWVWEGHAVERRFVDGDIDIEYRGDYRRPSEDEMQRLSSTGVIWPWEPDEPEHGDPSL